jgi:hypothetical protein
MLPAIPYDGSYHSAGTMAATGGCSWRGRTCSEPPVNLAHGPLQETGSGAANVRCANWPAGARCPIRAGTAALRCCTHRLVRSLVKPETGPDLRWSQGDSNP